LTTSRRCLHSMRGSVARNLIRHWRKDSTWSSFWGFQRPWHMEFLPIHFIDYFQMSQCQEGVLLQGIW
jgi:hypothetical protein